MTSLYPAYAIGIRAQRVNPRDAFAQPRCFANALHGMVEGAWELHTITASDPVPAGWRVTNRCGDRVVIQRTVWERITP